MPTAYRELWLGTDAGGAELVRLEWSRGHGADATLKVSAASDRDGAQALVGKLLFVERERLAAGELVWADLEGAVVVDARGETVGKIARVYNVGASDVAEVVDVAASLPERKPRSFDLPLVSDYLDLEQKIERTGEAARVVTLRVAKDVFDGLWSDDK